MEILPILLVIIAIVSTLSKNVKKQQATRPGQKPGPKAPAQPQGGQQPTVWERAMEWAEQFEGGNPLKPAERPAEKPAKPMEHPAVQAERKPLEPLGGSMQYQSFEGQGIEGARVSTEGALSGTEGMSASQPARVTFAPHTDMPLTEVYQVNTQKLQAAIIMSEILARPVALRGRRR